jgi:hypothetical protein
VVGNIPQSIPRLKAGDFLRKSVKYMKNKKIRYVNLHDCVYAATHCADEFRRRFLDAREEDAREKDGDIMLEK